MKLESIPLYALLMFTSIYMMFASDTPFWNGSFFVSNYAIMALLFFEQKDRHLSNLGTSLSLSILLFSVLKFFISLDQELLTYLNGLIFLLIAVAFYKLEPK
jgi:hypothetical protein